MINGAKERGLDFEVTKEEVFQLFEAQGRRCSLSGVSITLASTYEDHRNGGTTASLDRIDSSKGYILGNVQWVHVAINMMKGPLTDEDFVRWCRKVVLHAPD